MVRFFAAVQVLEMEDDFLQMMEHTTIESFMDLEENFAQKNSFVSKLLDNHFDHTKTLNNINAKVTNYPSYNVLCNDFYAHVMQR